jgi:23S rRNA G2445 N2-methylase RlmL
LLHSESLQERDKATALIKEVFPDAKVEAQVGSSGVSISCDGTHIVSCSQRDLYRKYQWPAAPKIKQHLALFKSMKEEDE